MSITGDEASSIASSNSDENTDNIKSSDTKSQDNSDSIISSESDHVSKNNLNFIQTAGLFYYYLNTEYF